MTLESQLADLSHLRKDNSLSLTVCDFYTLSYSGLSEKDSLEALKYKYQSQQTKLRPQSDKVLVTDAEKSKNGDKTADILYSCQVKEVKL